MNIKENISLRPYNTMGVEARCRYFVEVASREDLMALYRPSPYGSSALSQGVRTSRSASLPPPEAPLPTLVLGGGSNTLFQKNFEGLVIHLVNQGIEVLGQSFGEIRLRVQAGEIWKDFVAYTIQHGYWGVENMCGIPGCVGGAVVQNMGAYGQEISRVLESVEVFDTESLKFEHIPVEECGYGYRQSRFKRKARYIVWSAVLKLGLKPQPCLEYAALKSQFEGKRPTQEEIACAVLGMRSEKLPDVNEAGSVGSFFTNPVVDESVYETLQRQYPDIPQAHKAGEGCVKLSAAWLIDRCGYKGYREGDAGVYPKQPLVLVNYGRATGSEIWQLALKIQADVHDKFGVTIEPEVCLV